MALSSRLDRQIAWLNAVLLLVLFGACLGVTIVVLRHGGAAQPSPPGEAVPPPITAHTVQQRLFGLDKPEEAAALLSEDLPKEELVAVDGASTLCATEIVNLPDPDEEILSQSSEDMTEQYDAKSATSAITVVVSDLGVLDGQCLGWLLRDPDDRTLPTLLFDAYHIATEFSLVSGHYRVTPCLRRIEDLVAGVMLARQLHYDVSGVVGIVASALKETARLRFWKEALEIVKEEEGIMETVAEVVEAGEALGAAFSLPLDAVRAAAQPIALAYLQLYPDSTHLRLLVRRCLRGPVILVLLDSLPDVVPDSAQAEEQRQWLDGLRADCRDSHRDRCRDLEPWRIRTEFLVRDLSDTVPAPVRHDLTLMHAESWLAPGLWLTDSFRTQSNPVDEDEYFFAQAHRLLRLDEHDEVVGLQDLLDAIPRLAYGDPVEEELMMRKDRAVSWSMARQGQIRRLKAMYKARCRRIANQVLKEADRVFTRPLLEELFEEIVAKARWGEYDAQVGRLALQDAPRFVAQYGGLPASDEDSDACD